MENKRHLKLFANKAEYETNKEIMGEPHVVVLEDTQSVVYKHAEGGNDEPEVDYSLEYFTIEALEEGEMHFTIGTEGNCVATLQYCVNDNEEWLVLQKEETLTLQQSDKVKFKTVFEQGVDYSVCKFVVSNSFNIYGNAMSLIYGDEFNGKTSVEGYYKCFACLFEDCTTLVSAENLILPATTLADYCYTFMFNNCTSLTTAPSLQATTLANDCYSNMFNNCPSLTTAPALPATKLASYCYASMFSGCRNLNKITMLATDISASGCLDYWVSSVASDGTFIKNAAMTSLPSGTSGIPSGWNVEDYQG